MTGLLLGCALLAALAATGWRRARRAAWRRALAALPGGSRATAMVVDGFGDIDFELSRRHCPCGGSLEAHGERSEGEAGARLRVVLAECRRCEDRMEVWFDATRAFH